MLEDMGASPLKMEEESSELPSSYCEVDEGLRLETGSLRCVLSNPRNLKLTPALWMICTSWLLVLIFCLLGSLRLVAVSGMTTSKRYLVAW